MSEQPKRVTVRQILSSEGRMDGQVNLKGWVAGRTAVGGIVFVLLRDGTGYVQVSAKKGVSPPECIESMRTVTKESAVSIEGAARSDKRAPGGVEVSATKFEVVAKADPWPITKTAARSGSYLYDVRHLSIRSRRSIAALKIRETVVGAAFDFFRQRDFILISAPSFVQSAVEGGATLFEVGYFGKKAYLSQSAQFYEEAALPAFEKVWIFQPAFRAEKSRTPKHLTEFWMIEAEQAFVEQDSNMKLQEELLAFVVDSVLEKRRRELEILGRKLAPLQLPLKRMSYDDLRKIASEKGMDFQWGEDVPTEAERLVSLENAEPFFVTDYPLSARSFYHMTYPDRPLVTKSADLIAPEGFGELATGGQRISDHDALLERIRSQELPAEAFSWYLELRKFGMPPHSGFGIGVERMTRWLAKLKNIRSASLFPRTTTRISP